MLSPDELFEILEPLGYARRREAIPVTPPTLPRVSNQAVACPDCERPAGVKCIGTYTHTSRRRIATRAFNLARSSQGAH